MKENMTDVEQKEMLGDWWHRYGRVIAIAVLIGLLIGFGWRYWHQRQTRRSEQAAVIYEGLLTAVSKEDTNTALRAAGQIVANFGDTPYVYLARFYWASIDVKRKKMVDAVTQLHKIVQHARQPAFRQIARIRAARILSQQKQYAEALLLLKEVDDKTYLPVINVTKGDIYAAQGKLALAKQHYQSAKAEFNEVGIQNPLVDMKLLAL